MNLLNVLFLAAMLSPQAPEPVAAPAPARRFDVTSVKLTPALFASVKTDPGRLVAIGDLSQLIQQAYGVPALRVAGVTASGRYEVEGKVEGTHTRKELLEMLQTLLADRFKLTLHREMQEMQVDALVLAGKNTPKLTASATTEGDPSIGARGGRPSPTVNAIILTGQNETLSDVANYVSGRFGRIVVDKTGLTGAFDFAIEVLIDRSEAEDLSIPERDVAAHIFRDFVKDLGLKLESQRAQVEMLVVDHVEGPDPN